MKHLGILFLLIPFVLNALNIQAFVTKFVSVSIGQAIAYLNVALLLIGIGFFIKQKRSFPPLIKLWVWFFGCYYVFGLIANAIHQTPAPIIKTLIPVIYFFSFAVFLNMDNYRAFFQKVMAITFFIACCLLIVMQRYNFSLDHDGIYAYTLDRAGGVYGDANNAAVVCLLSFIFIYKIFNPKKRILRLLKLIGLGIAAYALFLTFSKTGFVVLFVVIGFLFYKLFNLKRILLIVIIVPVLLYTGITTALNSESLTPVQKSRIENIVNLLSFNTEKVEFSDRDILFNNMISFIYENPFIGNGINFSTMIRGHNTIFGVWADAGIITFLLFLFLLFQHFRKAIVAPPETRFFLLPVIFVLCIFMLSLQSIINQGYLMALFAYIAYGLESRYKSDVKVYKHPSYEKNIKTVY
ncbi:O-antigen ligase family protein [Leptobacterium sp. I13]|uniref:O-antigen ligase family protein n=1 Tax=Leptobacterium meishanense TaxID=3128904 RepID=UPI0030EBD9EA